MKIIKSRKINTNLKRLNEIMGVFDKHEFDYGIERIRLKHKFPFIRRSHKYESLEELDNSLPVHLRMTLQELGSSLYQIKANDKYSA